MQRLITILVFLWILPVTAHAEFIEGTHYRKLSVPQPVTTGDKIEVREFFWYGCSHCFGLEPSIEHWLKNKPKQAVLVPTPGTAPQWIVHAKAYYAFESLGVTKKVHGALFEALHTKRQKLYSRDSLADFAAQHGVDRDAFLKAFDSFGVNLQVEQARNLNKSYAISSVPTLVVDGKYLTNAKMAQGNERLMQVVNHLVAKSVKERKQANAKR